MRQVIDVSSNRDDIIGNAAKELKGAHKKREVFQVIYRGKKKTKTQEDVQNATGMSVVRILQECDKLKQAGLIFSTKKDGKFVFEKVPYIKTKLKQILRLSENKERIRKFLNDYKTPNSSFVKIPYDKKSVRTEQITIDDIDSFSKIKKIKNIISNGPRLAEKKIKKGIQKIIGQKGQFKDWGGEKADLYSTRVLFKSKRIPMAVAFKGKGTPGKKLVLSKMGKNGDQVQRLFHNTARLFIVMFQGEIDEAIVEQMQICAKAKSFSTGEKIYYCIIDGQDTSRLLQAYPKEFK